MKNPFEMVTVETAKWMTEKKLAELSRAIRFRLGLMLELYEMSSPEETAFIGMSAEAQAKEIYLKFHPGSSMTIIKRKTRELIAEAAITDNEEALTMCRNFYKLLERLPS